MEYKIVSVDMKGLFGRNVDEEKVVAMINKLGAEGWDLVAVIPVVGVRLSTVSSTTNLLYHFKRKI